MNVFDREELELDVLVVTLVLVAFACRSVSHRIDLKTQVLKSQQEIQNIVLRPQEIDYMFHMSYRP